MSQLNREFTKKDVQRMRNLITKKYGDATVTQAGYTKKVEEHKEGDIWEEDGKKWTIKNGIKKRIPKLSAFKELAHTPLFCPKCNTILKTPNDKKMYHIHKRCFECVIKFETQLKIDGKYEEYEKSIMNGNLVHFLSEYEEFLNDISRNMTVSEVSEDGIIRQWIGNTQEKIQEAKKQLDDAKKLNNLD